MDLLKQEEKQQSIFNTAENQDTTQIKSGTVQHPQDMHQDKNLNANHIQVEKNLQQLEVEEDLELLTDAQREERIEKAYEAHKQGTKLNALDKKSKRAKNMKKKVEYQKKSKSFKPPEPVNMGKLIDEAGPVEQENVYNEAVLLDDALRSLKIKNDGDFADNLQENFKALAKLDEVKAKFTKALNTQKITNLKNNNTLYIRTVITMGEQVRKYMIAQQQLMKNPYYTMLAKKDVAGLSDDELEKKANEVQAANPALADYYRKVLDVRSSGFKRAKGMDAAFNNAGNLVDDDKDNLEELKKTGATAEKQYGEVKKKDKKTRRKEMAENAEKLRKEREQNVALQEKIKQNLDVMRKSYEKVEKKNRELEQQDSEIQEYKILSSVDVWEEIQKNPANDMNTDEYQQLYGHNFQYKGPRPDSAYIKTGNAAIINQYIRSPKDGLETKRKEYEKETKDEAEIEKKLEEWHDEIKDTIELLKQNAKHDSIPQKCRLYRMCGDYVLKNLGLNPNDDKNHLVQQLNERKGTIFKEQNFSSTGYRADGDYFGVLESPIMLTILCEKGQKCFITANQRETEIIFDKPEFQIVKAERVDADNTKEIPLSSNKLEHHKNGISHLSSEGTAFYKGGEGGGIHLVVRLVKSDGDDPNK